MSSSRPLRLRSVGKLLLLLPAIAMLGCSAYMRLKPDQTYALHVGHRPASDRPAPDQAFAADRTAAADPPALAENDPALAPAIIASATTAPSTPGAPITPALPIEPRDPLNLADAPAIDRVIQSTNAQQIELVRMLQPVDGRAIYFGQALATAPKPRAGGGGGAGNREGGGAGAGATLRALPIIATRVDDRWRAMEIADDRAAGTEWVFVGSGPVRGHAWAVLDRHANSDAVSTHLLLIHSDDSGATWRTIPLLKPSPSARYDSICMSQYRGRVTVYQPPGESGARAGYYHYHTTDHGLTWDTPTYEPDSLTPADEIRHSGIDRPPQSPPARAATDR